MNDTAILVKPVSASAESVPTVPGMTLRHNFAWTAVGNIVYAACQWAMLAVLAKLGSPEWVGRFALGLALTAPVFLLTNLQLRAVQATDAGNEYEFGHYLALRLASAVVALLAVMAIIGFSQLDRATALIAAGIGLAKLVESVSDAFYGLLQKHERMDRISKSLIMRGIFALAGFGTVIYLTRDVFTGVLAMTVAWLLVLYFYDMRSATNVIHVSLRPIWNHRQMRALAFLAAPLGIVMMFNSLNVNIPRYALQHFMGTREVGIFAALAYLQIAEAAVINALGQSATPRLAKHFLRREEQSYWALMKRLFALGTAGGGIGVVVAAVAGPALLTLLYRAEYATYSNAFLWLMIGTVLANIAAFAGYGLTAARSFRSQIPLLIGESVVMSAACFILIPQIGLLGAAIAYLSAKLFLTICSILLLIHVTRRNRLNLNPSLVGVYES